MNISAFNEKITIQKSGTVTVDAVGNHISTWADHYACHAKVMTFAKDEKSGVITTEESNPTFEIRYCSKVKALTSDHYRVVFNGDIYNILSVDMMNYGRKTLLIKCEKTKEKVSE